MFLRYVLPVFFVCGIASGSPLTQLGGSASGKNPLDSLPEFSVKPEKPDTVTIRHSGDIFYDHDQNTVLYTGVEDPLVSVITDKGTEMFARTALVHIDEEYVDLNGSVSIFQGASISRSDWARYYWDKEVLLTEHLKTKVNGFLLESDKFVVLTDDEGRSYYEGIDAGVTLQDIDKPDSWLRGSRIRLYPEDSVEFTHLRIYAGGIPIFYFPYFSHSLNPKLGYMPMPGARSIWGAYLKNEYGFVIGEKYVENGIPTGDFIGILRYDYRVRRGSAVGFDMERPKAVRAAPDFKGLSLYYADDNNPGILLEGIPRRVVSQDRWRIGFQERFELKTGSSNNGWWRIDSNITVLSDEYMLEDFYPSLVMRDQEPDNTVAVVGVKDSNVYTYLFRFAPNDFYYTDERYPEMTWDRVRGAIRKTRFQYEGTASFGVINQYVPDTDSRYQQYILSSLPEGDPRRASLQTEAREGAYTRLHTYHEVARQEKLGVLTLTPKMGGGYTGYYGVDTLNPQNRALFFTGMGANLKITGTHSDIRSSFWGLNGIKHVIEPYINYSFVSTNHLDPSVPRVDDWSFSTNPQSLSVGRFTATDNLASWNTIRFGVRNLFITERERGSHQWLTWDLFMDGFINDPELDRNFSNMYSHANWNIKPWLSFWAQNQYPVVSDGSGFQEHNWGTTFMPNRYMEVSMSNRNLINHPMLNDSNQLNMNVNLKVSENSSLSVMYYWQLKDSTLERQEYMYYRNLGSWVMGVGYYSYYNRIKYDRGVMLTFTLKEYPSTNFPFRF